MSNWTAEVLLCAERIGEAGKQLSGVDDLYNQRQALIYIGAEAQRLSKIIEGILAPWGGSE